MKKGAGMNIRAKEKYVCKRARGKQECGKFRELTVVHSGWSIGVQVKNGMVDETRRVKQGHVMDAL